MLNICNLSVKVDNNLILDKFNLQIKENEIHAIMGPNGVGKSTICKVIMGDSKYQVSEGAVTFNDIDITKESPTTRSRLGIFLLNQNPIEIEGVSNASMLRTALSDIKGEYIPIFAFNEELKNICKMLELPEDFIHRGINENMSGGEKKKNELLHMWVLKPKFIILDEVDSGLDIDSLKIVAKRVKEYVRKYKASLLIITHHKQLLKYLKPDYIHILKDKKIIKTGDATLANTIEKEGFGRISETFDMSGHDKNE